MLIVMALVWFSFEMGPDGASQQFLVDFVGESLLMFYINNEVNNVSIKY